ncbi:uncharacterized protein LOC126865288 isoform X2 [Bombus huntii]|uniref:uncharacterized protein LOC126865288 isoform X2 n=1 Tax=Bombus huntii TaxID=85661 RepID=UPI0021A9948F|nr:uncharacterized protein LOC126865288 isoform X2 [Bombus huntii]
MADDESSSTSDESLDAKSEKFNPMKALYSKKIQLSASKAPIYDNVSKFEAVMSGLAGQKKKKDKTPDVTRGECSRQRFLPHQEPVTGRKTTGRPDWSIEGRNVLAKMQRAFGPLGMLHGYMESRTRVKEPRNVCLVVVYARHPERDLKTLRSTFSLYQRKKMRTGRNEIYEPIVEEASSAQNAQKLCQLIAKTT